ncbi:GNAT family N-acetyltransferase [Streptomyces griseofuscus]|uniref:N-acetyltransferase n=3 Tax=Actinomycetes TaxID=1760 RepID=A0A3R8RXQ2_9ACTN|nr:MULTISPECIES: GNAT family N-acetyltransferase [Streptomyces]MBJ7003534.1 GNAT family N-acetyltransferase [Streptomyces sp. CRPSP2-6A1]MYQ91441.1 GNAT family N-acetyltransferase [Streptomyces sp. SID4946]MYR90107.1 GNAT family N-acetyltransferase [Streptomyces sp. SID685]RRQ77283.1 N-acetyltransferase [Streptomyces griseofuscus]RRQ82929.1 N-acetyltransferase [Streptomyces griseofuscus]
MDRPSQLIECGEFVLRRLRGQRDFVQLFTLIEQSRDHLRPWMPWADGHDEQSTRELLASSETKWESGELYNYVVAENGELIGMCQAYRAEPRGCRLGYWLHPCAVGRGIATRATAALAKEMFALADVGYLEIAHDVANAPSRAVPRRLGFTELRREQAPPPAAPSGCGIDLIWRLNRPATGGTFPGGRAGGTNSACSTAST